MSILSEIKILKKNIIKLNASNRHEQIMALYVQVCIANQFQINLAKITEPFELIDLSWILAICFLKKLSFKSAAFMSLKKNIHKKLMIIVSDSLYQFKSKLIATYVNEVEHLNILPLQKIHSYMLPPEVTISLLLSDPNFACLCIQTETAYAFTELNDEKQNINHHMLSKQLPENNRQTVHDGDRPSAKAIPKCEFIIKELEEISISFGMAINREILWNQLKQRCKENSSRFKLGGKRETSVVEKATGNVWNREALKYHMDSVIAWHKQSNSQLYS